ncbi:MAG: geranylgeranylglyceryl/heptaprenylglyceryl phosphate synthase [Candidatus Thermoplasmatota archaeon]|nr:geranylgeranylglyceryl/heptaprenylglyceryl phosphate synthase [Candidatus Thermoplasmatota archaeon]
MKVREYVFETLKKHKIHMTLIDPAKQDPATSGDIAAKAQAAGTDAIMVGGSTGVTQENLDASVEDIKQRCRLPVIYFPSGAHAIASKCDAIYFMSVLNSRNVRNLTGEHVKGAPVIKKMGIETISMGYVIVEPGMKVGEVGEADLVKRGDLQTIVGYALTTEFFGMDLLYLEAGSGAPEPVPSEMISAVRRSVSIPIVVGGGIVTPEQAAEVASAGADIVVTGTLVENGSYERDLRLIVDRVHGA